MAEFNTLIHKAVSIIIIVSLEVIHIGHIDIGQHIFVLI